MMATLCHHHVTMLRSIGNGKLNAQPSWSALKWYALIDKEWIKFLIATTASKESSVVDIYSQNGIFLTACLILFNLDSVLISSPTFMVCTNKRNRGKLVRQQHSTNNVSFQEYSTLCTPSLQVSAQVLTTPSIKICKLLVHSRT